MKHCRASCVRKMAFPLIALALFTAGCGVPSDGRPASSPVSSKTGTASSFYGTVTEIYADRLSIRPDWHCPERQLARVISIPLGEGIPVIYESRPLDDESLHPGQTVCIRYGGELSQGDPARLDGCYAIEIQS